MEMNGEERIAASRDVVWAALNDPEVRSKLARQGVEASPTTSKEFGEPIASDLKKYALLVKQSGVKVQ